MTPSSPAAFGEDKKSPAPLRRWPSVLWMYLLAVVGVLTKPRWPRSMKMPNIEVSAYRELDPSKLLTFRRLTGWVTMAPTTAAPPDGGADAQDPALMLPPNLPAVFLAAETFRLAMAVLTHRAFPFTILGTVVNKRARYELVEDVEPGTLLLHTCRLDPETRTTPGGHLEFQLRLTSRRADTSRVVWRAVLTLVLMNPKKKAGGGGGGKGVDASAAAAPPAVSLLGSWTLPEDAGRRYAALDGDRSPMHMYSWTARLMGFPRPVANVHYVMARAEAAFAQSGAAGSGVRTPVLLEGQFMRPTLLPSAVQLLLVLGGGGGGSVGELTKAAQPLAGSSSSGAEGGDGASVGARAAGGGGDGGNTTGGGGSGGGRAADGHRAEFIVRLAKDGRDVVRGSYTCAAAAPARI